MSTTGTMAGGTMATLTTTTTPTITLTITVMGPAARGAWSGGGTRPGTY
ncbi:hypothetical protein ACFVXC_17130 [Streptomyces sp. NPDC058257]